MQNSHRTLTILAIGILFLCIAVLVLFKTKDTTEAPSLPASVTVDLSCTNGYTLIATYRLPDMLGIMQELALTVTQGGVTTSYVLTPTVAASGAKFETKDGVFSLWEHQSEFRFAKEDQVLAICNRHNDTDSLPDTPQEPPVMSEEEARDIAETSCIKGGEALASGTFNETTQTWWFDANLNATKPGCNPACVVSNESRTAEINWRCTGLIPPQDTDTTNPTTKAHSLTGKTWTLVSATSSEGVVFTPRKPDVFTLTFNTDGHVDIGTDCNNMGGSYSVRGATLAITDMMSTLMFCEDAQESEYSALLSTVSGFTITNEGVLLLTLDSSTGVMRFK